MARASTNALTKRYLEWRGVPVETVQRFYGGKRHDLFGIIDTVALFPWGQMWVQNCSAGTLKPHRDQIDASKYLPWIDGQRTLSVELWEWKKKKVGRRVLWFFRAQRRAEGAWSPVGPWVEALDAQLHGLEKA